MWFRQDLRLRDNPALTFAAQHGTVLPIYILDRSCPEHFRPGGTSKWWLHHSLQSLQASLNKQLHCLAGDAKSILLELVKSRGIKRVVWNRCYEPWQIKRDIELKQILISMGIEVHSFNGQLLWEPWQVLKKE